MGVCVREYCRNLFCCPGVKGVESKTTYRLPSVHPSLSATTLISCQQVAVTVFHSAMHRFHRKRARPHTQFSVCVCVYVLEQTHPYWQICIIHRHDHMKTHPPPYAHWHWQILYMTADCGVIPSQRDGVIHIFSSVYVILTEIKCISDG